MQFHHKRVSPYYRVAWARDPLGGQTQPFHPSLQGTPLFEDPSEYDPALSLHEGKLDEVLSGVQVRPEDRTYGGQDA